jgi:hypothetical protein
MPVMDLKLGYFRTFSDQVLRIVKELVEVVEVFGLTCNCC